MEYDKLLFVKIFANDNDMEKFLEFVNLKHPLIMDILELLPCDAYPAKSWITVSGFK